MFKKNKKRNKHLSKSDKEVDAIYNEELEKRLPDINEHHAAISVIIKEVGRETRRRLDLLLAEQQQQQNNMEVEEEAKDECS